MSIRLTKAEKKVAAKLAEIKKKSTSHSPSPAMLESIGVHIKHDFCYLSNPHATELFLKYFRKDFKDERKLRNLIEHYPSQNCALAEKLFNSPLVKPARRLAGGGALRPSAGGGISAKNIFVGNGATEIIQAVLQTADDRRRDADIRRKIVVPVPTFSPYLEFAPKGVRVVRHQLWKKNEFRLDTAAFLAHVKREKSDTVVIINPNNPEGGYRSAKELQQVLQKLRSVETVIVDESFIHFTGMKIQSASPWVKKYPNLIVIKSLSKDFGIAGLRLGYAVMSEKRVSALLARGYLWNVSGFGEYFLELLSRKDFLRAYEKARRKAVGERDDFFRELQRVKGIKVYPSKANMFLIELLDGSKARDLMVRLLVRHGIYLRTCYDKVGLTGELIRIASRKRSENKTLTLALKETLSE